MAATVWITQTAEDRRWASPFNDDDIDRIREIKSWIDNGVQVGKVKSLLSHDDPDTQHLWREQQETLLRLLQAGNLQRLRGWIKSRVAITRRRR